MRKHSDSVGSRLPQGLVAKTIRFSYYNASLIIPLVNLLYPCASGSRLPVRHHWRCLALMFVLPALLTLVACEQEQKPHPLAHGVRDNGLIQSAHTTDYLNAIENMLQLEKENLAARVELARYSMESGDLAKAQAILIKLLTDYPIHPESNRLYAGLLVKTEFPERALSRLDRSLVLWPGNCDTHLDRLQLLINLKFVSLYETTYKALKNQCRDNETLNRANELLGISDAN